MEVMGLAASSGSRVLVPHKYSVGEVGDNEVIVRVTHCGLCRSDLRLIRNELRSPSTHRIPGHEIVGEVVQKGSDVVGLDRGTRVGIGWQSGCCGRCEWCLRGEEHLCLEQEETCVGRPGGFATHVKVQARFAIPVPEGLDSADAAPFLCAGITVFSPVVHHGIAAGQRAAVVGIGGLGHLALQFLRARGCDVTAFSSSVSKEADARSFGASVFMDAGDSSALAMAAGSYDFIICTSPGLSDLTALIALLRPKGTLCLVGIPSAHFTFPARELIDYQKSIAGSPIGSPATIAEMLRVVVETGVRPRVEGFGMTQINAALQRLDAGQLRYRAVLNQDL